MTELQKSIIEGFNALESIEEQHSVLDALWNALYESSYLQVIGNRVVREKDAEISELSSQLEELRARHHNLKEMYDKACRRNCQKAYSQMTDSEKKELTEFVRSEIVIKNQNGEISSLRKQVLSLQARLESYEEKIQTT